MYFKNVNLHFCNRTEDQLQQGDRRQLTAVHSLPSLRRVIQLVEILQEDWGYLTTVFSR